MNQPTQQPRQQGGGGGRNKRFRRRNKKPRDPNAPQQQQGQHPQRHQQKPGGHPQQRQNHQHQQQRPEPPKPKPVLRRYGVVFYDSIPAAKADLATLQSKAKEVDQLNIVIRAEADMDDAELNALGKVFAGAAWTLIHERRVSDGWYNDLRE